MQNLHPHPNNNTNNGDGLNKSCYQASVQFKPVIMGTAILTAGVAVQHHGEVVVENAAAATNPVLLGNGNGKRKPNNKVKQEAMAACVAQHSTIKKRRGRPAKVLKADEGLLKRPRGRPLKPRRPRGRPPKAKVINALGGVAAQSVVVAAAAIGGAVAVTASRPTKGVRGRPVGSGGKKSIAADDATAAIRATTINPPQLQPKPDEPASSVAVVLPKQPSSSNRTGMEATTTSSQRLAQPNNAGELATSTLINPMPSQHHKAPKTTTTSTISQRRVQLFQPNNGGGALAPAVDFLPPPQRIVAAKPAYSSTTNTNTSHHCRRRPQQLQLQPNIFRDNAAGGLALNMDAAKPQPHNNNNNVAKMATTTLRPPAQRHSSIYANAGGTAVFIGEQFSAAKVQARNAMFFVHPLADSVVEMSRERHQAELRNRIDQLKLEPGHNMLSTFDGRIYMVKPILKRNNTDAGALLR